MNATQQRDLAIRLAPTEPQRALALAEAVPDPWFSTQALAAVLRYGPADRMGDLCQTAMAKASGCSDAYGRSAVLAWLIRALVEREQTSRAATVLNHAMVQARQASPAGSRAEAIFLLYEAAFPLGPAIVTPLLLELAALHQSSAHWRASRALVHALAMHSMVALDSVSAWLAAWNDPGISRKVPRFIQSGLTQPREFFGENNPAGGVSAPQKGLSSTCARALIKPTRQPPR